MIAPTAKARLTYIDSLRGIAALLVVLMHNIQPIATGPVRTLIYDIVDPGKVGVVVFFAISGFVIPFSFSKGPAPLRRFAISRLFRLYPAYWLSMVSYLVLLVAAGTTLPSLTTILANVTMIQAALGQPNVLGVYWTLFIEVLFYVLCAAAFAVGLLRAPRFTLCASLAWLAVAIVFALARHFLERKVPVAIPLSLSIMFWGTLWREAIASRSEMHRRYAVWMLGAYVVIIPIVSLLAYDIDLGLEENWIRYLISYLAALAIFVTLTTVIRLSGRFSVLLGAISYSLYLFHVHARDAVELALSLADLHSIPLIAVPLSIFTALLLAWVIFKLVERPMNTIGHRLAEAVAAREVRRTHAPAVESEIGS
ncbi:acyltransferase [Inquilinus sp. Marseille-Q2685]|uniref:acyltransferase family protein n=1 Tax=Inquilinus sp. Marseille-Q2685 TaxID=2866581 RepID=UPI001CE4635F|nr:acyltransferase [Inquilinus sp. Marseille-Q2685]